MSEFIMQPKNKKTFQDIYFEHLNRILEITKYEFTGGYQKQIVSGSSVSMEYVSDKKEEYCQVVEAMLDLTHGYFDKKMKEKYKLYETSLKQITEEHFDKDLMQKSAKDYQIFAKKRLLLTRGIFRDVCDFASRINNFQAKAFTESDEDIDEELVEEEENEDG